MNQNKVLDFNPQEILFKKVVSYTESMDLFLREQDRAIPLLLRALGNVDYRLKQEIILILGNFAKKQVAWPLYNMIRDPGEDQDIRQLASIQLSVILPFLEGPQTLIDNLLRDIKNKDPLMRLNAAFALGWEGNYQAFAPLVELLYDSDIQVQQTAVNALFNLGDNRILNPLLERLEQGPLEQKRCILFNLWRFYSRQKDVLSLYIKYMDHENPELRFDSLALLGSVTGIKNYMYACRKRLGDVDPRIRALALKQLDEASREELLDLKQEIRSKLSDPDMEVKKAALTILKRL